MKLAKWQVKKLDDILECVKNGRPYDLMSAPHIHAKLSTDEKAELQKFLVARFNLWANTWIVNRIIAIKEGRNT